MKQTFYSNGKLLLTGEYVVLDGAIALALPTKKGQLLEVSPANQSGICWKSFTSENVCWFETVLDINASLPQKADKTTATLYNILYTAKKMNPKFLSEATGYLVETHLQFPQSWGLGSSSTLINSIAQWARVDAFQLLQQSFGGSGYDIAAAQHDFAIFYRLQDGIPRVKKVALPWDFTESLFFVHLNKKQDSKEGIKRYKNATVSLQQRNKISDLTQKLLLCYTLQDFENLIGAHERIISEIIGLPTVKSSLFSDYDGAIKSLGAWGGDFILATGTKDAMTYFKEKGYHTCIPYAEMIL